MFRATLILIFYCMISLAVASTKTSVVKTQDYEVRLVTVAENLEYPWSVDFLPDGDYLVTEKTGNLVRINQRGEKTVIQGTPEVADFGQGGLLDVLVHPDFESNQTIFMSYAAGSRLAGAGTEVAKATLKNDVLTDVQVIFKAEPKTKLKGQHFGSRLAIANDGSLFITLGERGNMDEAQNPGNHLGSVIRIHQDGSIPDDNPFLEKDGFRPEIFSYGHRNVQGMAKRPNSDQIWTHEHGPKGGDEVNILKAGANYGWPEITYGIDYTGFEITDKTEAPGMEQPVIYWDPSIAPSGMTFYSGDKFEKWNGDIFVGALAGTHLRRLNVEGDEITSQEEMLEEYGWRIRDVAQGPDGYLYILTDEYEGRLVRLEPQS